jgi:hypothetical protein
MIRSFPIASGAIVAALCGAAPLRAQRLDAPLFQVSVPNAANLESSVPVASATASAASPDTSPPTARRPRAIEYSDWYYRRLTVHRIASYPEIPVMAAEFVLGERLIHDEQNLKSPRGQLPGGLVTAHVIVATGLAALFGVNTITGAWNLWDSRHDPNGRTRRLIHSISMLTADAGFTAAGVLGGSAKHNLGTANLHRAVAISAMGVATAGTCLMWFVRK